MEWFEMSKTPSFCKEMKIHLKNFLIPRVNNKILHIYQQLHGWVVRKGFSCHGVGMAPASVPFRNLQSFETSHTKRYHAAVTLRSSVLGIIWQILLKLQPSQHTRSVGQEGRGHSLYNNMVLQFDLKLPSFKATCVGFCFSAESWSLITGPLSPLRENMFQHFRC